MPLDASSPITKISEALDVSASKLLITDKQIDKKISDIIVEKNIEIVYIDDILYEESCLPLTAGTLAYNKDDAIYLYFTSGSTGKQKGVLGRNESLAHFINWEIDEFDVSPTDVFAQLTLQRRF